MKLVGERVDHGDAGVRRHFLEHTLMVNASDDALHPALEVARHVGDGLPRAERGGRLRVVQKNDGTTQDRKSTRLNSSHLVISYAVFCLKKKKKKVALLLVVKNMMRPHYYRRRG